MAVTRDKPLLFATVGTDHHPFDRLVAWLDRWLAAGGDEKVHCIVQTGTSVQPKHAESAEYLDFGEMQRAFREARLVVCHGGPGTIMLARAAGNRPIVVPRVQRLGEHVDDHQVVFTRRISRDGTIAMAEDEGRFRGLLDEAVDNGLNPPTTESLSPVEETVRRVEMLVDDLVMQSNGGRRGTR